MHKEIIWEAWDITSKNKKKLFKYWFFPSLFTVIIWVIYISYQIQAFNHYSILWEWDIDFLGIVDTAWTWIKLHAGLTSFLVFLSFFCTLMYFFSPIICEAALVHYIAQIKLWKEARWWIAVAFDKFFHLLEFSALLSPLSFIAFFTESSFVIRNYWIWTWLVFIPFFTLMLLSWIIVTFLFSFTQQFIILENKDMIWWIKNSSKLVLWNIKHNFFLWGIMLIIIVRILLNIVLILLIPVIVIFITQLFTSFALIWLWLTMWLIVWAMLIWSSAYLLAGFTIFTSAVWTIAFITFRKSEIENNIKVSDY